MRSIVVLVGATALCLSAGAAAAQPVGGALAGAMRGVGGSVARTMGAVGDAGSGAAQSGNKVNRAQSHHTRAPRPGAATSEPGLTSEDHAKAPAAPDSAHGGSAGGQAAEVR